MNRFNPTVFIGLGGSGVNVIRWLKKRFLDEFGADQLDREPVAFVGIDFDPASNESGRAPQLDAAEYHFFDPQPIASCINNLDRIVIVESEEGETRTHPQFEEIRAWYPDLFQNDFRPPQVEANGASQWRPIGRIGFFLNDQGIIAALRNGFITADRKADAAGLGDVHTAYIVSSIAGGTGAGLLLDVATNIRKVRPGVSVRGFLLLPEIFETAQFRSRIAPNAYATLWELANLKNQHVVFEARYPKIPEITIADSPTPFQRIFLFGPYVGDTRPFRQPDDAYPYIAEVLKLATTREIRAAGTAAESNAAADATAPLSAPESRHVFCTTTAMGIRLLSFDELADLWMSRLLYELDAGGRTELLNVVAPLPEVPRPDVEDLVNELVNEFRFDRHSYFRDQAERFFREHEITRGDTNENDLREFVRQLDAFCGVEPEKQVTEVPGVMKAFQDAVRERFRQRIRGYQRDLERRPRAYADLLTFLNGKLPTIERQAVLSIENLPDFPRWLSEGHGKWSLTRALVPERIGVIYDTALEWFGKLSENNVATWVRQAVVEAVRDVLSAYQTEAQGEWSRLGTVRSEAGKLLRSGPGETLPFEQQIFLSGWDADVVQVLDNELARLQEHEREEFTKSLFDRFLSFYHGYSSDSGGRASAIQKWIDWTRNAFKERLAERRVGDRSLTQTYKYVSPRSLFTSDRVRAMLLRCRPHVFVGGRTDNKASARITRILLPADFPDREKYAEELYGRCTGYLGGTVSVLNGNGNRDENRIVIVIDDLFYPAEAIGGIYDYHTEYMRFPTQLLLHIHREWPSRFPPLVTRGGARGRVSCGNPRCPGDIHNLDRAAIICPTCRLPIRNRCGNRGCLADDLGSRADLDAFVASRTCPECRKYLRTYWWRCEDHGDVPIDKMSCPTCVRTPGRRRISTRPDLGDYFVCQNCLRQKQAEPFMSAELRKFLLDGVDHHDYVRARNAFATTLVRDGHCPKCGALLAPVCPEPDLLRPDQPHYLYRERNLPEPDRFRCYLHTDLKFYTCHTCQFPVREQDTLCRRCETPLDDCRFCTPRFLVRIPSSTDAHAPCPKCTLPRRKRTGLTEPPAADSLFCSNLFGCPAGGHFDQVSFAAGTVDCRVCHSDDLPLRRVQTRDDDIRACRHCSALVNREWTGQKAGGNCCLCGRSYEVTASLTEDQLKPIVGISRALRCNDDLEGLLHDLRTAVDPADRPKLPEILRGYAEGINRPAVRREAWQRLEEAIEAFALELGCHSEGQEGRPRDDC